MQVISRRLCTGAVITTIAAGIIIVGTAIMAGTIVIMDGTGITTTIAAGFDGMHAPVGRLLQLSHPELIKSRCRGVVANTQPA